MSYKQSDYIIYVVGNCVNQAPFTCREPEPDAKSTILHSITKKQAVIRKILCEINQWKVPQGIY